MRRSVKLFTLAGLVVALVLVVFVAPRADQHPDGLESVAAEHDLDAGAQQHDLAGSPLAEYGVRGIGNASLGTALAGIAGVLLVFAAMYMLVRLAKAAAVRRDARREPSGAPPAAPSTPLRS